MIVRGADRGSSPSGKKSYGKIRVGRSEGLRLLPIRYGRFPQAGGFGPHPHLAADVAREAGSDGPVLDALAGGQLR